MIFVYKGLFSPHTVDEASHVDAQSDAMVLADHALMMTTTTTEIYACH